MDDLKILQKIKALSDESRLKVITFLNKKADLSVYEIREMIGLSQ